MILAGSNIDNAFNITITHGNTLEVDLKVPDIPPSASVRLRIGRVTVASKGVYRDPFDASFDLSQPVGKTICLEKLLTSVDGRTMLSLTAEDWASLPVGRYFWDLTIIGGDTIVTPFAFAQFTVLDSMSS
jgi:hypothetical protein